MSDKWEILAIDPWIKPFQEEIFLRMRRYQDMRRTLLGTGGRWRDFACGHLYFGFHRAGDGWVYREWAPAADQLYLTGDFNGWNKRSHPLTRQVNGVWEVFLPGAQTLAHEMKVKVIVLARGREQYRIPLYINKVIQDKVTNDFCGQIWQPDSPFVWNDQTFQVPAGFRPLIYETHIGMSGEAEGITSYLEFASEILPRVKRQGYNTIQIMALMEHPYYASFGYHVSNYFAASSWFGNPEELKYLVNEAHKLGIVVLMDLVQSHAVKNESEGISCFDGTDEQFFHSGARGVHSAWDSRLFNYGKHEVIHFLLSSVAYWLQNFHLDGFRFDGVTSMIYHDHGLGTAFTDYSKYFSTNTDIDALNYLQFANELIREIRPDAITIAEDMSGMPGMCLPVSAGGIGFDYRLAMGLPDFWTRMVERRDEDWDMHAMWHDLTTTRPREKRIAYVESHDQALVGDKTLIFRMADQEMYWHMAKGSSNLVVERAVALHKMIRLITISSGAEGYLNFMGNEFGHPEWIDFPRAGNGWSFKHCRRQWSLADNPFLRYSDLNAFDVAMLRLADEYQLLHSVQARSLWIDQEAKIIAYTKQKLVFVFNFHPHISQQAFYLPLSGGCRYQVVLDTDELRFGGQGRIDQEYVYSAADAKTGSKRSGFAIYLPCRTALVLQQL